jgi:hypothetical protein
MTVLFNRERTNTDLDNARLATGFDIGIKDFDLESEKHRQLLQGSASRLPARRVHRMGSL